MDKYWPLIGQIFMDKYWPLIGQLYGLIVASDWSVVCDYDTMLTCNWSSLLRPAPPPIYLVFLPRPTQTQDKVLCRVNGVVTSQYSLSHPA